MKNREIYETAIHLLAEPMEEERLEDYAIRAPYLLGGFLYENSRLDASYRQFNGLEPHGFIGAVYADLDADFPFAERFATAAGYYLASMLVIEENGDLSDKLFDIFCDSIMQISAEIPASLESITDVY